ncbi:MAG: M23 family metallopeptidase [Acidobacteriota bacterium]
MRKLLVVFVLLLLAAGGTYVAAGRIAGPQITVVSPPRFVGTATPLEVDVAISRPLLASLTITFEQDGKQTRLFSLDDASQAGSLTEIESARVKVAREIGRATVPGLRSGKARIHVTAGRFVLRGLRAVQSTASHDVEVRLEQPKIAVLSTRHYINLGGSEAVVYRVSPSDAVSGVLVGDTEYPGYPAAGATIEGVHITDPAIRVAIFALRYDQALTTPMRLFARDEAGNTGRADFDHRTFPKPSKASRIEITDAFLGRVVPSILAGTTEVKPTGSLVDQFVVINGELRRKNAATIAALAKQTSPEILWRGEVFHPYTNSTAESAFADRRTYFYQGREIDKQVHLGFDLASYAGTSIVAANHGKVLYAAELGIYGNCVIIDHGMGLQSLYGHMSIIGVKPGDIVNKGQEIGKSGMTGLAGGDHLHFTMLVNGQMVNPVEWWDAHWIQDRILLKLREASGAATR